MQFLPLPESRRLVGSALARWWVGASYTKSFFHSALQRRSRPDRGKAERWPGRASSGTGSGEQLRVGALPLPRRAERTSHCPTPPHGEFLFVMLERPALYACIQRLTTHRLGGEDPVCFEMLTVAFGPCQPGPHLRQGLLFHIFPGKISWLTARALPCRSASAQSMCRVLERG